MTSYDEVADSVNMTGAMRERYTLYMRTRWGGEQEALQCTTGYATEWAHRFLTRSEYERSDGEGKRVLDTMRVTRV